MEEVFASPQQRKLLCYSYKSQSLFPIITLRYLSYPQNTNGSWRKLSGTLRNAIKMYLFEPHLQSLEMPRKETLSAITPNRYYHLQATLKYVHETQTLTTAIIEQDSVQRKIKFPRLMSELQQGAQYSFQKCFYSQNGWIRVDSADKIKLIEPKANEFLTLSETYDARNELNGHYVTTILQIVEIGPAQKKLKDGNELTLTIVKGYADGCLIDLTIWNRDISADLIGKAVILEGMRVKLLTNSAMVLVSTVYTKLHEIDGELENKFDPRGTYRLLSQVYNVRTIQESQADLQANGKSFSIVTASVEDVLVFDYDGCSKCRKKIDEQSCKACGEEVPKGKFWVAQLSLKDESGEILAFVFDEKILGAFRLAKKGTLVTGKIKSSIRTIGEEKTASNVLTGVNSIQF